MPETLEALELYAGPGGVSEGLRRAGITDANGIEINPYACQTAVTAGHRRVQGDVTRRDPLDYDPKLLHGSPPCQGFSLAGRGAGRRDGEALLAAVRKIGHRPEGVDLIIDRFRNSAYDPRSAHTLEPLRWIAMLRPEYVTLEQVPMVGPVWEEYARAMTRWGYSCWAGAMNAEQYGVPQTRRRAILIASRYGTAEPPPVTHSRYHIRTPRRLDPGVEPWISMADALGWTGRIGFPRRYDRGERVGRFRGRDLRPASHPALTVTEKSRSWVKLEQEWDRRVNNQSGTEFDKHWPAKRPAPTVAGRNIITMPGANANRYNGSTKSRNDGLRVEAWEAGVLQGFDPEYPWRGNRTEQFQQVGNAVPPPMMQAIVEHLMREEQ